MYDEQFLSQPHLVLFLSLRYALRGRFGALLSAQGAQNWCVVNVSRAKQARQ